jgi:hypothetical protein
MGGQVTLTTMLREPYCKFVGATADGWRWLVMDLAFDDRQTEAAELRLKPSIYIFVYCPNLGALGAGRRYQKNGSKTPS